MKTKIQLWLYRKYLANYKRQANVFVARFWLTKIILRRIESELFCTNIIEQSAQLEAQELADMAYQRKNKEATYYLYQSLFKELRFNYNEIWIIKGSIYCVEQVDRLFDVQFRNIETQEKLHINRLFPLCREDFKYHSNLSYDPPWLTLKRKHIRALEVVA